MGSRRRVLNIDPLTCITRSPNSPSSSEKGYEVKSEHVERSWDYLLKTPNGSAVAFICAILVLVVIVFGGLIMRAEIHRQREAREQVKNSDEASNS